MRRVVVFGTGGFAREVHQVIKDINRHVPTWEMLGFVDDNPAAHGTELHGLPVLGGREWAGSHREVAVAIAIGSPASRKRVAQALRAEGCTSFATLVHPAAWVGDNVTIEEGSIVCAGCLITTDLTIGRHVILNLGCTLGHDTLLADFVTASPSVNVSGCCRIGEGVDVGTGAKIIQGITLGEWSVVGAGAVVVRDLPPNITAVGSPARPIRSRPEGWHEN
ncbi:MAG: acetyltransferase [Deltaproteobacteria bacterium]|nr:acetyltransferase [Deltaproteobacteria bacterium]